MPRLENNQLFPALTLGTVAGGSLSLPGDLAGHFAAVLVYRGSWCPYCQAQLSAFQRAQARLAELDIATVALSVDDQATSAATVDKLGLEFPVAYGADAKELAGTLGSYLNEDPLYLQSTGFVLSPEGRVLTAVYSSGAIGRLVPEDVAGLVRYVREHA